MLSINIFTTPEIVTKQQKDEIFEFLLLQIQSGSNNNDNNENVKICSEMICELCDNNSDNNYEIIINTTFDRIILPILTCFDNNNNNNAIHLLCKSHNIMMKILKYIENNMNQYINNNNNIHFVLEILRGSDLLLFHQILIETKYSFFIELWNYYFNYYNRKEDVDIKISNEIYSIFEYNNYFLLFYILYDE